jgi:serine/threonine-protein kinase
MATCGNCGATSLEEGAAFCGTCGSALGKAAEAGPPAGSPLAAHAPTRAEPAAAAGAVKPKGTIPAAPISAALKADPNVPPAPPAPPAGAPFAMGPRAAPNPAPPAGAPGDKPFTPPKHLPAGTLVDKKYAVIRVLGEGGMGVVYLARDIHTGLDVVVKAVRSELAHRDDVRARTLAEGRALAQIDHPNVVHLRAVAVEGTNLYLVMQYIDGESLDKIIARHVERREPMPIEEALAIFRQVASGVGAAHQEGVIHRDLKPANVLIRKKDKVAKVTDFGIALVPSDTSRPQTRGILGSLWYMSPEQVTGRRDLDQRVDVYALGIMLYQMLVGRVPFDSKSDYEIMKHHAETPMPRAQATRPDVPPQVDDLIQRACAKDRGQRFQTCEELVAAVDRLLGIVPLPTLPGQTPPGMGAMLPPVTDPTPGPAILAPPGPTLTTGSRPGASGEAPIVSTSTGGSEPIPLVPKRRVWPWIVLALVLIGGGAGAALAMGLVPGVPGIVKKKHAADAADAGAPRGSAAARDAGAPSSGLAALAGAWVGNGRELEAVLAGSDLEFRVKKPEQFAPQSYQAGDARFVLRETGDANVYAVEDRIRPVPPTGKTYDPRARGTCQEVWTSANGEPLRARFDGSRLSVEFAKIEPVAGNFTSEGSKITSCVGLRDLKASKVVSVLSRP